MTGSTRTPPPRQDLSWQDYAKCAELPIDKADRIFFPSRGVSGTKARKICTVCPVVAACRNYALSFSTAELPEGIFAGLSANERAKLRRRKRAAA